MKLMNANAIRSHYEMVVALEAAISDFWEPDRHGFRLPRCRLTIRRIVQAYFGSEPESRAVLDAVAARPNIGSAVTNHTFTGCLLAPPGRKDSPLPASDVKRMQRLALDAVQGTGPSTRGGEDDRWVVVVVLGVVEMLDSHRGRLPPRKRRLR